MESATAGRPPRQPQKTRATGIEDDGFCARCPWKLVDESELNPVMAELRELKTDIRGLSRSLESSLDGWYRGFGVTRAHGESLVRKGKLQVADILDQDDGTTAAATSACLRTRNYLGELVGTPHNFAMVGERADGRTATPSLRSQCSEEHEELRLGFSALKYRGENCRGNGVREDHGGGSKDVEISWRVESSARAVSRQKDVAIKALRAEEEETCQLLKGLREAAIVNRRWKTLSEASSVLKQRLESTERIRLRQKELIAELRAVQAETDFTRATMEGRASRDYSPAILHHFHYNYWAISPHNFPPHHHHQARPPPLPPPSPPPVTAHPLVCSDRSSDHSTNGYPPLDGHGRIGLRGPEPEPGGERKTGWRGAGARMNGGSVGKPRTPLQVRRLGHPPSMPSASQRDLFPDDKRVDSVLYGVSTNTSAKIYEGNKSQGCKINRTPRTGPRRSRRPAASAVTSKTATTNNKNNYNNRNRNRAHGPRLARQGEGERHRPARAKSAASTRHPVVTDESVAIARGRAYCSSPRDSGSNARRRKSTARRARANESRRGGGGS